jgi:PAS domain S-box-containing protein
MLLEIDGTVRLWNEAAERIFGWSADEVLGRPLPAVPPERREEFRANLARLARGERLYGAETLRLSKHRGSIDVALWAAPVSGPDGQVQCLSLVADISDRKEAERERERHLAAQRGDRDYLARLQRVTAALAEAATLHQVAEVVVREGCAALGAEHGLLAVPDAPGTLRLLAWRGAYAGIAGEADTLALDSGFAICAAFRGERVLIEDEAAFAARFPAAAPTLDPLGTRAAACVPVRSGDEVRAALGFRFATARTFDERDHQLLTDLASLTALALVRADLYESERAARRVAEEALTTAREAEKRKDEFLAMLGHELRNPLAPILLALQVIQLQGEDAYRREHVIIERQVRHLERLVDDLLDVSRITRGKVELKRERIELADVVAKAIELTSPLLEQKSHRLDLDVPRAGLVVEGDYVRLTQVVANLLTNAAKYTPDRGRITLVARAAHREITLVVRDTGVGIAPDLLPHVFDMFVQAPQTLARSQGGLGLGLTIVSRIVALHGGRVAASSEGVGRGSEFVVRLPAADPASAASLHATLPGLTPLPVRAPRRILVVEDNPDAAALVAGALAALGHEVSVAYDGPAALELARTFRPQVVCLDLGLPLLDGYETARRLRADVLPGVPLRLVAITGYGQEHDRARARAAGIDRHLVKPVDLDVLVEAIDGE